MGNKAFSIHVNLENTEVHTGDRISGRLSLRIDDPSKVADLPPLTLRIQLLGRENTSIQYRSKREDGSHETKTVKSKHTIVQTDKDFPFDISFHFRGRKACEVPFEWQIPEDLPSTMEFSKKRNGDCHNVCDIRYEINATVVGLKQGWFGAPLKGVTSVKILRLPRRVSPKPVVTGPREFDVNTALLWSRGKLSLWMQTDATHVGPGDQISVQIRSTNTSSIQIRNYSVRILEHVHFLSHNQMIQDTRTALSHTLAADPSTQTRMTIPSLNESYQGKLMQISHELLLVAETDTMWTTNPKLSIPLVVQPTPDLPVAEVVLLENETTTPLPFPKA